MRRIFISIIYLQIVCMAGAVSPYISKVLEYRPAPGQFINELPEIDDYSNINAAIEAELCGSDNAGLVSLGGFGGYIIFKFDHAVVNVVGGPDFKIRGNSFASSSEPGIVSVSVDTNGNGIADDEWYELAGSEFDNPLSIRDYSITYYRPDENKPADPDPGMAAIIDRKYIRFVDNQGVEGYIARNSNHQQSYWPAWLSDCEQLTFSATRLPDNAVDKNGNGKNWYLTSFEWGYADNIGYDVDPGFNIENARDKAGNKILLDHVDFIRVHSAINQQAGWLGEVSTEIAGAIDLHPEAVSSVKEVKADSLYDFTIVAIENNCLKIDCQQSLNLQIAAIDGTIFGSYSTKPGTITIQLPSYQGIIIISSPTKKVKINKIDNHD